ncbi:hypothetical protein PNOK_0557600 [Pyrrhoderma noxium]|uniref:Uncharacterized protein n=1 Tax=Pyrrhoderma noxium TaxID=2282107 RepID=A0A286UGL0_9AGAM|nr:hypothetical protein PNOK_0557600 [Pyrrhoderma noxium]
MAVMTKDQIRHQVINLRKTLVLLENSVKKEDWSKFSHKERNDKWLKAQSILSGINYCKGMLNNLTPEHYDYGLGERSSVSGKEFHEESNRILEKLESTINEVYEDLKPVPRRLTPILPTIPKPVVQRPDSPDVIVEEEKEQPQAQDPEIPSSSLLDPLSLHTTKTNTQKNLPPQPSSPPTPPLPPPLPPPHPNPPTSTPPPTQPTTAQPHPSSKHPPPSTPPSPPNSPPWPTNSASTPNTSTPPSPLPPPTPSSPPRQKNSIATTKC